LHWSAEVAGVPEWLIAASLDASGDRAETAALLLPPPTGTPPSLAEVVDALGRATRITAHSTLLALWSRLPPEANVIVNRLASGTFRARFPVQRAEPAPTGNRCSVRAVMILAQAVRPEITLALWQGGSPVTIARLPLTLPETPEVMAWIRANIDQRFGPVRQVKPVQVFRVEFDTLLKNARRKSGYELQGAVVSAWLPDVAGIQADPLGQLDILYAQQNDQ
jgi:hypothetical protein